MTIIEEMLKAAKEAAGTGMILLRKSQMALDFSAPHHVAYTRVNDKGTVSNIKAKGSAPMKPTPIAKQFQTGPNETYFMGDKGKYTGKTDIKHGGTFYEIEMQEGKDKGATKWITKAPVSAVGPDTGKRPDPILHGEGPAAIKQGYVDKVSAEIRRIKALDRQGLLKEIQFASRLDLGHMKGEDTASLRMHALHARYSGNKLQSYYDYANANKKLKLPLI